MAGGNAVLGWPCIAGMSQQCGCGSWAHGQTRERMLLIACNIVRCAYVHCVLCTVVVWEV